MRKPDWELWGGTGSSGWLTARHVTHHLDASRSTLARRLLIPLGQWPYLPDPVESEGGALTKKVTKVDETEFDVCRKRLFFFCGFRFRYHHSATTSGSSPPPISFGTASRAEQPTGVVKEVKNGEGALQNINCLKFSGHFET